jgi:formylglycine-generating enzyme
MADETHPAGTSVQSPMFGGCCAPSGATIGSVRETPVPPRAAPKPGPDPAAGTSSYAVPIAGGEFSMGAAVPGYSDDGEGPVHRVRLSPFRIEPYAVTNARFAAFVEGAGYVTDAERYGWSFVFGGLLPDHFQPTRGVAQAPWWRQVYGADWRHPEGPHADAAQRADHPVVHVSWNDAVAFCAWSGERLPTEAEWEYAARGGLPGERFPWGAELEPSGEHRMNVFQGRFPLENSCADGHAATAPADAFPPNGYGLYNMTGNVWEWCADWFDPGYYETSPPADPPGPRDGMHRVMRGGSYLCHASYCNRYRVDARSANEPDSSAGNVGFRVAGGIATRDDHKHHVARDRPRVPPGMGEDIGPDQGGRRVLGGDRCDVVDA